MLFWAGLLKLKRPNRFHGESMKKNSDPPTATTKTEYLKLDSIDVSRTNKFTLISYLYQFWGKENQMPTFPFQVREIKVKRRNEINNAERLLCICTSQFQSCKQSYGDYFSHFKDKKTEPGR